MSDEPKGYNGWKNYETWAVALHIDNDEGTYHRRQEMAREAWANAPNDPYVTGTPGGGGALWTREQCARYRLADALKDWIEEERPDLGGSLYSDLLGAALSEVDWSEIAEGYIEESAEEDKADEEEPEDEADEEGGGPSDETPLGELIADGPGTDL